MRGDDFGLGVQTGLAENEDFEGTMRMGQTPNGQGRSSGSSDGKERDSVGKSLGCPGVACWDWAVSNRRSGSQEERRSRTYS